MTKDVKQNLSFNTNYIHFKDIPLKYSNFYYFRAFIEEKLGSKYVENKTMDFEKSFEETSPSTPIFFILSPGVNPLKDLEDLGGKMGFTLEKQNFHNVSLGKNYILEIYLKFLNII